MSVRAEDIREPPGLDLFRPLKMLRHKTGAFISKIMKQMTIKPGGLEGLVAEGYLSPENILESLPAVYRQPKIIKALNMREVNVFKHREKGLARATGALRTNYAASIVLFGTFKAVPGMAYDTQTVETYKARLLDYEIQNPGHLSEAFTSRWQYIQDLEAGSKMPGNLIMCMDYALHARVLSDLPSIKALNIPETWLQHVEERCKNLTWKKVKRSLDKLYVHY